MTVLLALLSIIGYPAAPGVYSCTPPDTSCAPSPPPVPDRFPVLCYHAVGNGGRLSVSSYRLRSDLEQLRDAGFYLVTPRDLEDGLTRVPAGLSPVMITFDDGWQSQFNYLQGSDGSLTIDPGCALGVLEEFYAENPGFGRGAVFNISCDKTPFGQSEFIDEKLNFLLDNGYCIGNHTARHRSFMGLPQELWSSAITGALSELEPYLGLRIFEIDTAAWPGGRIPAGRSADERLSPVMYEGNPAIVMGFSVDGALADLGSIGGTPGRLRIGRVDMGLYSVPMLLRHSGLCQPDVWREDLHSPMPFRLEPVGPAFEN